MRNITDPSLAVLLVLLSMAANGQEQQSADDLASPLDQTVPVAEEEIAAEAIDTGEQQITEDEMLREFARFRELLEERNFDEADISAKRVVEMTIKFYGPQSHEAARALNNLAIVQHNNGQYAAAIQNFTSSIETLEVVRDRLNEELVNPLRGLGAAQLGNGRPDLAAASFGRATHITHVNEGPHNIEQVEILESLAEARVRLGDLEGARDTLDRIYALNVRHFENDVLGLLPSLMRRAEWQHRAGYYNDERATYRRAIRIIETSTHKNDPRLIEPLLALGRSYYYFEPVSEGGRASFASTGEAYFKRAARIAENAEDYPWLDLAKSRLALADYYVSNETQNRARKLYLQVWTDLSLDEDRMNMRRELLERPIPIREEALPRYTNGSAGGGQAGNLLTGTIQVDYTVSARGRVKNIRTEANPIEFTDMQRMVHREVRQRLFRPALVDGVPAESENQVYTHEFFYEDSELEEIRSKKAAVEKQEAETP
ncbi:MAG: tetratricopeptide repeat protein [Gammaproteobacteria bacterium]|jgi:tetratricopeptide (TPR) repeat protein|nr:tetratricopeptide repeat protein [Gammaproteobacteria bacterium]